jgi:hypothetical protein
MFLKTYLFDAGYNGVLWMGVTHLFKVDCVCALLIPRVVGEKRTKSSHEKADDIKISKKFLPCFANLSMLHKKFLHFLQQLSAKFRIN